MLVHNPSRSLLPRQESTLSFHVDILKQNESSLKQMFANIPILIALYCMLHLIDLSVSYYALHSLVPEATTIQAVLSITTIKSIVIVVFLLVYIKIVDQSLYFLDNDCRKLILIFSLLQLLGSLSHYYSFVIFPFSQAATFSQLLSGITILLSYVFIKQRNDLFMIISIVQLLVTLTFKSAVINILLAIISPLSSSFMGILQQVTAKQINRFTIIFYTCLLNAPILIFLSLITGSLSFIFDTKLLLQEFLIIMFFSSIIITCICQLFSFQFMNVLINSQLRESTIWIISTVIILLTIPIQFWIFKTAILILPFFSQLIILVASIIITNK